MFHSITSYWSHLFIYQLYTQTSIFLPLEMQSRFLINSAYREKNTLARYSLFNYTRNIKFPEFKKYNFGVPMSFESCLLNFVLRGEKILTCHQTQSSPKIIHSRDYALSYEFSQYLQPNFDDLRFSRFEFNNIVRYFERMPFQLLTYIKYVNYFVNYRFLIHLKAIESRMSS